MTGWHDADEEPTGERGALLRWRQLVERLGGLQGVLGVLLCAALPVVPFALAVSSVLGRHWGVLATWGGAAAFALVVWVVVLLWVGRMLRL